MYVMLFAKKWSEKRSGTETSSNTASQGQCKYVNWL